MATPEEELYVLVSDYEKDREPFIYAWQIASLAEIRNLQRLVNSREGCGKTRIARLQFVEDE